MDAHHGHPARAGRQPDYLSFIQIDDPNNSNDGDLFVNGSGGIGIGGSTKAQWSVARWYRVAFAVDMADPVNAVIPNSSTAQSADQAPRHRPAQRPARAPAHRHTFADEDGNPSLYVNSIQIRNYKMSDAGIAALRKSHARWYSAGQRPVGLRRQQHGRHHRHRPARARHGW